MENKIKSIIEAVNAQKMSVRKALIELLELYNIAKSKNIEDQLAKEIGEMSDDEFEKNLQFLKDIIDRKHLINKD
jgi:hypothetical protein